MSHESKFKRWNPFHGGQAAGTAVAEVAPKERAQVEQLIANGKHGIAVDIAKQVHKRVGNAASEELLVSAYAARPVRVAR